MPIDRGIIDQQLRALGESPSWWEVREMRDVPAVLQADERILAVSRGKVARPRWVHRPWLVIVTDRRLLCLRSGSRSSWSQIEVGGSLIGRVTLRIGPFRGRVVVVGGGYTYRLLLPRADAYKISSALATIGPTPRDSMPSFRPTIMARRVIDHVLALPAAALQPTAPRQEPPPPARQRDPAMEEHVDALEGQIDQLRQQVDFLEQLLHQHHAAAGSVRKLPAD
jgi:hypothetical protein